jgi:uridine kinase
MRGVVGVAGAPGSGKSTLLAALARALPGAAELRMDDYENMTRLPLDAVARWYRAGADIDAFDFPQLQAALARGAAGLVLFETQFGRAHRATGRHIGFLVWIDTPLDIALARALRASLERGAGVPWLRGYLDGYLGTVRGLLDMQKARVAPGADLILDGRLGVDTLAAQAADAIRAHFA